MKRYSEKVGQSAMYEDPHGEWVKLADLDVACKFSETPKTKVKGQFKCVVYHPQKGIQTSQDNSLLDAKSWASYMIYRHKCVPMYFEDEATGEMYPPIDIPSY